MSSNIEPLTGLSTSSVISTSSSTSSGPSSLSSSSSTSSSSCDPSNGSSDLGAALVAFGAYYQQAANQMGVNKAAVAASQMNMAASKSATIPSSDLNNNSMVDSLTKMKKAMINASGSSANSALNRSNNHENSDGYDDDDLDDEDSYGTII